jgi:hypothetical protein
VVKKLAQTPKPYTYDYQDTTTLFQQGKEGLTEEMHAEPDRVDCGGEGGDKT